MWARIKESKVVEIVSIDPNDRFHPSLLFAECDESTKVGDLYESGEFFPPIYDVDSGFRDKQTEIVQKFKAAMAPVTSLYTAEEIASFPTQEPEALAWDADNTAPTPLIDFIVAERSTVDKATLVGRIISNASNYKGVAGPAIGKKKDFEDSLYALQVQHEDPDQPDVTQADIDAIVVDYS